MQYFYTIRQTFIEAIIHKRTKLLWFLHNRSRCTLILSKHAMIHAMPSHFVTLTHSLKSYQTLKFALVASRIAFGCGVLGLLLVGCGKQQGQSTPRADQAIPVSYLQVTPVNMPVTLETIAQTEGAREVEIRPRVGGILLKRFYAEGNTVEAGQTLFQIDPEPFRNALAEARAAHTEQQVKVARAKTEEQRQRRLAAENFVSQRALDSAVADLAAAEATLQAAKARVKQAELNLSYTTVKAPINGVTGRSQVSEGALLSANTSLLTTLSQLSPIWVRFSFSDNETARLGERLSENNVHSVRIMLTDGSEYPQQGRINFAASTIDAALGTQQLRATFDNADQRILPGQFVRIRVSAGKPRSIFIVPQIAVMTADTGRFVYVIDDNNTVAQRQVVAGDWIGKDWIILDGLQSGDKVVVDNLIKLMPGKTVDPKPRGTTVSSITPTASTQHP